MNHADCFIPFFHGRKLIASIVARRRSLIERMFCLEEDGWRSLSAIARPVTRYPAISGPAWFGIAGRGMGATGRGTPRDAGTTATATA